jgi:hypothetical protein
MKYFSLLLSVLFFLSCNPMRRINMRNISNEDAEFIFKLKEDSAKTSPLFISTSPKISFNLKNKQPYNRAVVSLGFGKWTEASIKNIADDLESFEIKHAIDSVLLTSEAQIVKYFFDRRKGTFKSRIEILVH